MEDLLASIRKAINEDIGPEDSQAKTRAPARSAPPPAGEEQSANSAEIQQLREKISRTRNGESAASRDPAQRAASLAAALRSQTPRRSWREIEPTLPPPPPPPQAPPVKMAPRLRTSIIEPETPRQPLRAEPAAPRPATRFTPDRQMTQPPQPAQPAWPSETASSPLPREPERPATPPGPMLSGESAQAVQSAFGKLAESVLTRAMGEQSIEGVTRELLKVMLKQWLDDNLPAMVERLVREEIERVARTGR